MRSAHISRRQAEAAFDGLDVDYEDVLAGQAPVVLDADDEDEVDRELLASARVALMRVSRDWTDEVRARRATRRADREVLRSLSVRLDGVELGGEAA